MEKYRVSAVIPAYNEDKRIGNVLDKTKPHVDEIIVIDDKSEDDTAFVARNRGAKVISNEKNLGYIESIKKGFKSAKGKIIVTLDADGEHDPEEIPDLIKPILNNEADLVLGKREKIARISEQFINWLTKFKVNIKDSGTGFRAIKKELALKLKLKGKCTCGIFVLEANSYGAKIAEVPITINNINKSRKIAWHHFKQIFFVLQWLMLSKKHLHY